MDSLTIWIIGCVINAILSFVLNVYLLKHGENINYVILFYEIITTLTSFVGLIVSIIMAILIFLMEYGDKPVIKSKHNKN